MRIGGKEQTPAPVDAGQDERAALLWDLFGEEIRQAGAAKLMALVGAIQRGATFSRAPEWAQQAMSRIAEGLDDADEQE